MSLQVVDEQGFSDVVANADVAVVEFGAVWCPPCKALLPILEELAGECGPNVAIAKADADDSPELASRFGVMSLPTVIVFKGGEPVDKLVGLRPKQVYQTVIGRWTAS